MIYYKLSRWSITTRLRIHIRRTILNVRISSFSLCHTLLILLFPWFSMPNMYADQKIYPYTQKANSTSICTPSQTRSFKCYGISLKRSWPRDGSVLTSRCYLHVFWHHTKDFPCKGACMVHTAFQVLPTFFWRYRCLNTRSQAGHFERNGGLGLNLWRR